MVVGQQTRECSNGPDRHQARKKIDAQKKQKEHDYCSQGRVLLQSTKKMDCPAAVHLRSIVRFPTFKIESNSKRAKHRESNRLAAALTDEGKELCWEHRVYVTVPGPEAHRNHFVDDIGCMTHDVHKNVISKIHSLVADGVRNVAEMKRHITAFSMTNFPGVSNTSNRFYPNNKCLRNHMYAALSLSQYSTEDQENLQQHVGKWKIEMPEDNFHYLPSPKENEEGDVEDFIFVYQTSWQRRLLSKYGNEICLLDATYKVCKCDVALYFICVSTNVGYFTVGCFLLPSETIENIGRGLQKLKEWNPEWNPSFFMTDYDIKEITAIETTFPVYLRTR